MTPQAKGINMFCTCYNLRCMIRILHTAAALKFIVKICQDVTCVYPYLLVQCKYIIFNIYNGVFSAFSVDVWKILRKQEFGSQILTRDLYFLHLTRVTHR